MEADTDSMSGLGALISAIVAAGTTIYAAVFMATGIALFLPQKLLELIGIDEVVKSYRMYVGIAFVISASLLVVQIVSFLWSLASVPIEKWQFERRGTILMKELTEEEKIFLRPYILLNKNTQYAPIENGIVQGLAAKKIIFRSSNVGHLIDGFAYNLQPYMRRLLNKRPDLLD